MVLVVAPEVSEQVAKDTGGTLIGEIVSGDGVHLS
jgi:hypothetical protein